MASVLIPVPHRDFDPTETGVPWKSLRALGHRVVFATPDGKPGVADQRMLNGQGLGFLAPLLIADANGRQAYTEMAASEEFRRPIPYLDVRISDYEGLLLPGGHAPGMRSYLESEQLQAVIVAAFERQLPVGAICHGVVLAARSRRADGHSVLFGRRTTALTRQMELTAWALTCVWLGHYYRTYRTTVQDEVTEALAVPADFIPGPMSTARDSPSDLTSGFIVRDGNYLSARWPGDAHRFGHDFASML